MKLSILLFLVPCVLSASVNKFSWEKEIEEEWNKWKMVFNRNYDSLKEELSRKMTWSTNLRNIIKHNFEHDLGIHSYRMEMNHFGDLNVTEFKNLMNGYDNKRRMNSGANSILYSPPSTLNQSEIPVNLDWRKYGYVTEVKNQGHCGSCWAFSSTGALEGQHYRKTGNLVSLSEQNLIDCSRGEGNSGCEGGLMDQAFRYVAQQQGIDAEASYRYMGKDETCRYSPSNKAASATGYMDIPRGSEKTLKLAVAYIGPVSVAIDASHKSIQFYSSGVYDEPKCSTTELDHGVLVVGYGVQDGQDYWIVKNSWGPAWGMEGYIMMSRNKHNQCGIASSASFPTV